MQFHEVLEVGEKIPHNEFVKRLRANRFEPTLIGVKLYNDPRLRRQIEVVNGQNTVMWERVG